MKKFIAVVAVLAMTLVASVAMAQVTVDGSIEFLMRSFKNTTDWNDKTTGSGDYQNTYERIRLGVNAKHEGVKGRFQIETDWDQWADGSNVSFTTAPTTTGSNPAPGFETRTNGTFSIREGWIDFNIPGAGAAHIKVGRQFLQLGNGWFFRSSKYGSDAWLVGLPGKNTVAFVNVKAAENNSTLSDDTDAYVLLDNFKIDDTKTVGAFFARAYDRRGVWTNNALSMEIQGSANATKKTTLDTIGLWFNGTVGPVKLQAEFDFQMGDTKEYNGAKTDFEGTQLVLQATMPMDALTLNATLATGSGDDPNTPNKFEGALNFLDKDPRFTLIYEYLMTTAQPIPTNNKNSGFANTQAIGLGGMYKINKMVSLGADLWLLSANEKVSLNGGAASDDLGTELDVKLLLTLADQLTWNTAFGMFKTGDAYKSAAGIADDVTAIQSVLSYKF